MYTCCSRGGSEESKALTVVKGVLSISKLSLVIMMTLCCGHRKAKFSSQKVRKSSEKLHEKTGSVTHDVGVPACGTGGRTRKCRRQ